MLRNAYHPPPEFWAPRRCPESLILIQLRGCRELVRTLLLSTAGRGHCGPRHSSPRASVVPAKPRRGPRTYQAQSPPPHPTPMLPAHSSSLILRAELSAQRMFSLQASALLLGFSRGRPLAITSSHPLNKSTVLHAALCPCAGGAWLPLPRSLSGFH